MRTLLWYRERDLRIADHAPLREAARSSELIAVFVLDPGCFAGDAGAGATGRFQFLLESLRELDGSLRRLGSQLVLWWASDEGVVVDLTKRWQVDRVLTHSMCEPSARETERRVALQLGRAFRSYSGQTLHSLGTLHNQADRSYSLFTPFARAFRARVAVGEPLAAPRALPPLPAEVLAERGAHLALPTAAQLQLTQNPAIPPGGERAARARLRRFAALASRYDVNRDRLDQDATSRLSVDLALGTLSPRRVWCEISEVCGSGPALERFRDQLIWREFSYSTLWERPEMLQRPFRDEFVDFPWRDQEQELQAWQQGRTGYPLVDAAARQLLAEGFVPNRARMVAASFLCKHLLLDYRRGEQHYLAHLVDADPAQNNANWQWCAGVGASAPPFFRIMNPVVQGKRFDPRGHYVRSWVPELARLPEQYIHEPWIAPPEVLAAAGVRLGLDYPLPIVDPREARARALETARRHARKGRVLPYEVAS